MVGITSRVTHFVNRLAGDVRPVRISLLRPDSLTMATSCGPPGGGIVVRPFSSSPMRVIRVRNRVNRADAGRIRSRDHMAYIRSLPCSVPGCRREPVDVHHLTCSPEPKARSLKAGDNWTVPLCHGLHHVAQARDGVHRAGNERAWWAAGALGTPGR
jgi:hypothetical protein